MLNSREDLEKKEDIMLAPYACRSLHSRGRLHPEAEPLHRTAFQRDRDRILHCTAFRRLEYKTQVFINYEGDHYRTRLTHTLEVAQIARSIALALGANVDLTEAICLAHDIGHPPFGHSGETALNNLMKEHGGFEHNRHSYRVVTELEVRYPQFKGLNLTVETLEGLQKHQSGTGSLLSETLMKPGSQSHIEAQIADVSDSLAYTAHDLDDGLRSGMLTLSNLQGIELWNKVSQGILIAAAQEIDDLTRHQVIRTLIGFEIDQLLKHTHQQILKASIRSVDDIRSFGQPIVGFDPLLQSHNQELRSLLHRLVYQQYRVQRMAIKAEQVLADLFQVFCRHPETLPSHIYQRVEPNGLERTICDYIAGMTDRFAIEEHQKIFNPAVMP